MALKHAESVGSHPRARLACLWSTERSEAKGREAAERLGFERSTTDYHSMLSDEAVDVILVCSPDRTHPDFVLPALNAGKHVFCEKPLAQLAEDYTAIGEAVDSSGKVLAVGMNSRYRARYTAMKDAVAGGDLGDVRFVRGTYVMNIVEAIQARAKPWALDFPDGVLQFVHGGGTHIIDLMRWLGGEIETVFARGAGFELTEEWGIDTFSASFGFESGAIGELLASASAYRPDDFSLECWLERGSVLDDAVFRRGTGTVVGDPEPLNVEQGPLDLYLEFEDLVRAIDEGGRPLNSFDEALRNFRVINAIQTSIRTGEQVELAAPAHQPN